MAGASDPDYLMIGLRNAAGRAGCKSTWCFADQRGQCAGKRKNRRYGSAFPVGVSVPTIAPQRPSGRGPRERSAPNANRRLSAKAKAAAGDDLGPGVLDHPPQSVGRLAQGVALRPARHSCAVAARAVPEILGSAFQAAPPASRSSRTAAELRRLIAQMIAANPLWRAPRIHGELKMLGIAISERTVSRLLRTLRRG
jgi:hypothetical protein